MRAATNTINAGTTQRSRALWLTTTLLLLLMALSLGAQAQNGYVYVNNQAASNTVSAYSVSATGSLTALTGSPFSTGGRGANVVCYGLTRIALGRNAGNDFLYVANTGDQTISAFLINPATGGLTGVPGSPFASGLTLDSCQGVSLAATPKAPFLFASSNGRIQTFTIAANGALALAGTTPNCCTPNASMTITNSSTNTFLAVSNQSGVSVFGVNTTTGALSPAPGSPFVKTGTGQLSGLDYACDGSLLFAGEATSTPTQADVWTVNTTNGALTPVLGSPFKNSVGNNSNIVVLTPDNSLLLESNQFSNSVTTFTVNPGGSLSNAQKFGGTTAVHTPAGIAIDASGTYAMVADDNFGIAVFRIGANGTLSSLSDTAINRPGEIQDLVAYPPKSCAPGHLSLTVTAAPNPVPAGTNIAYTVALTNNGPTAASAVLTDLLPTGTTSGGSATIQASSGAARLSNVVTITTAAPHGFVPGIKATISGVKDASFNGTFVITSVPTALTFTYAQTAANASSGSGTATVPACTVTGAANTCGGLALTRYATFPSLAAGATETAVFMTTVSSAAKAGTMLSNTSVISNKSIVDPNPNNQSVLAVIPVVTPAASALTNVSGTGPFGGNATLTATLTDKATPTPNPLSGKTLTFIFGGNSYIGVTNGSGIATVSVPLGQTTGGTHPNAFTVNFNGDATAAAVGATGTLTVTPAILTVTADNISMQYGGPAIVPPATAPVFPTLTYTVTGFVNGDTSAVLSGAASCTTTATLASPVGTYPITCTVGTLTAPATYTLQFAPGTFTVTPVLLQVQGDTFTRAYGAADPTFIGTLTTNNNVQITDGITATWATAPATSGTSPVGTYSVVPTLVDPGGKLSNYQVSIANGTMIITAAPLTVAANSTSRLYGDPNPAFTGTITGLQNGETISVTYSSPATPTSPVGTYPIVPAVTDPNNVLGNYTLTIVNGTLTVNPAPLTVNVNSASRLYGDPNPLFTGTITGIKNGDNITATYSTPADPTSAVGTYPIAATLVDPNNKLSNYAVTINPGTLTVNPAPLSVTAADASRLYGDPNPAFTGTITGIKNGDNITATYASAATPTSPVGTYAIVPTLVDPTSKLGNYTVTSTNGTLTVNPAPLVIQANDATKNAGDPNPVFTGTITGTKNGDAITASYSSPADATSPAGTYPIIPSAAPNPLLSNYSVTLINGTLTVQ